MFILKGCHRCGGDLHPDEDGDLACLQCGALRHTQEIGQLRRAGRLMAAQPDAAAETHAASAA